MHRAWLAGLCALAWGALACAGSPDAPAPGTSAAWGDLRIVPREGVHPAGGGSASYGDRRLRDVEFVDYSHPGFAVVYVEQAQPPAGRLELAIRESRIGTEIAPAEGVVGAAGHLSLANETAAAHVISYPAAGLVRSLAPGERAELAVPRAGEQAVFLLDVPSVAVTVFAAPGAYSVVSSTGRFRLTDLPPGPTVVRAWHPRFPPAAHRIDLLADTEVRVDLEIGVGRGDDREGAAHAH
jgi:hypothetical protein